MHSLRHRLVNRRDPSIRFYLMSLSLAMTKPTFENPPPPSLPPTRHCLTAFACTRAHSSTLTQFSPPPPYFDPRHRDRVCVQLPAYTIRWYTGRGRISPRPPGGRSPRSGPHDGGTLLVLTLAGTDLANGSDYSCRCEPGDSNDGTNVTAALVHTAAGSTVQCTICRLVIVAATATAAASHAAEKPGVY